MQKEAVFLVVNKLLHNLTVFKPAWKMLHFVRDLL